MTGNSLDASTLHAASAEWHHTEAEVISIPALTLLYHPDAARVGERALLRPSARTSSISVSRREPLFAQPGHSRERPLEDPHLSRQPWHLRVLEAGVELDPGVRATKLRAGGTPIDTATQFTNEALASGIVIEVARRVVLLLHTHQAAMAAPPPSFDLVGASHALVRIRSEIERVADLDIPVLIRGETGTGKELVASALHRASRRDGAFVAVNLAAIPPSLAGAELFGARKGAFTGATQPQAGYFSRADGGNLFLDEIGEAPVEIQIQLLRVLETGDIQPLGAQQTRSVDVRLITATDADLEARVADGTFRAPLLHRLAGFELRLPPLRDRRDDFGLLFFHFLRQELDRISEVDRLASDTPRWLAPSLVAQLATLDWPGNVRQLRNVVRQLVIGSRGLPRLEIGPAVEVLLAGSRSAAPAPDEHPGGQAKGPPRRRKPATVTEGELSTALQEKRWNLKKTAAHLRVSRTSLYALIEKYPSLRAPCDIPNDEIRRAFVTHEGDQVALVESLRISQRALRRRLREMGLL